MPKSLVLGNGNILVGLDQFGQVDDFYFPFVGFESHVNASDCHKIGIWDDNKFSWLDDNKWEININYQEDALASQITAKSKFLELELNFNDAVYNEDNIFLRKIIVKNTSLNKKNIKLFFNHRFQIAESIRSDTAYFDPQDNTIIYYKSRKVFLINAKSNDKCFADYSTGLFNQEFKEGTYKDAEDGTLEKNPVEHGRVSAVIGLDLELDPGQEKIVDYWLIAAQTIKQAKDLNKYVLNKTPEYLLKTTRDFWKAWVNKQNLDFKNLNSKIISLFKKSLFIIRTHADNRGAIIASSDSDMLQYGRDTYSYMWPRDGAISAMALDKAGDEYVPKRFFEFCGHIITDQGYFMHKYLPDKSLGSSWHPWLRHNKLILPIQEDETALVIYALFNHYQITKDLEFIEKIYNSVIKKAADFMVDYRDDKTKLPKSTYDLWEEHFGVSLFACCAVYGALQSAGEFAKLLGKTQESEKYKKTAQEIKQVIFENFYNADEKIFYKIIKPEKNFEQDKSLDMSGVYGLWKFGLLKPDDKILKNLVEKVENNFIKKIPIHGVPRYEGDCFHLAGKNVPGNPWIITTLWLAQIYISQNKLDKALNLINWVVKYASPAGILPEQLDPDTGEPVSAAPLTWSHAEFVITVLDYLEKFC